MRQVGLLVLLLAAVALATVGRAGADPATAQLYPIDLRVEGGEEAWHSEYMFRLEWERPPIASQGLPIAAVGYRLLDPVGAAVREDRLGGDRNLISIQIPPVPGAYTAEVWLEGPGGERGAPVAAVLRYDHAQPGSPRIVPPYGWVGGEAAAISILPPTAPVPLSGIRGYAVSLDRGGESWPCAARDRCAESEIDLRTAEAFDRFSLGTLPEGPSVVRVIAVSGAGIPSAEAASAVVRVDATRPEASLAGVPTGWSTGPVSLVATATDALSGMEPDGTNGPMTAIAVDGGVPRIERGDSAAATVTGEGIHRVEFYARDAAGNTSSNSPRAATISIDESPPQVSFAASQDPADPERIEATVADPLSGADHRRGSIAVREAGTDGLWQSLPTAAAAGRLVARWDSQSHPAGIYEFRAIGYDLAGNAASSNRRANHTRMVLVNPLKQPVLLQGGFAGTRRPAARTVPYGRSVLYRGRLISATGSPLGGQPIRIVERFGPGAAAAERSTPLLTAADGTFALRLPRGPSRQVEARFAGTRTLSPADGGSSELEVLTSVAMRTSARTARVGGAPVVFGGQVHRRGARLPSGGLPVELQFRVRGEAWAEFRTVQTDRRGRFRYAYGFSDDDSRGVRFQFRAYISGGGWPYEPAASKPVSVTGR
jgi:hypothetical protein